MGELLNVGTAAFKNDAQARYAELRKQGPVHQVLLPGKVPGWLVVGYDVAKEALTHPALTRDASLARETLQAAGYTAFEEGGSGLGGNMLTSDPPAHTRLRKLVASAFTPRRVDALAPRIREIVDGLLDEIAPLGEADLVSALTAPLPMTVTSELLGVPREHHEDFGTWSRLAMGAVPGDHVEGMRKLNGYLLELLREKREHPRDDLLSALVAARDEDDGRLSSRELLGTAALLVVAGYDTTVNLLGNAALALLRNAEQAKLLRDRPELIPGAVEEFLRYDSPVEHTPFRFAAEDVELGGVTVPRGSVVVIALTSASRDCPVAYGEADELDVERPARHLAFGHGIHYCIGAPLARLEAEIAIGALLNRFPDLELDPVAITWVPAGITRGPMALPVHFRPVPARGENPRTSK